MNDYDFPRVSEQVFVTRSELTSVATDSASVMAPPSVQDWHRADIIAAVKKTGTTIRALSRQHQLAPNTLANALTRKWPRAEQIIADHLNLPPWAIWPSRYPDKVNTRRQSPPGTDLAATVADPPQI